MGKADTPSEATLALAAPPSGLHASQTSAAHQAPAQPAVDIRGVWTTFPLANGGEQVVHQDLDLSVRQGEVLSLVGGSGTGKTTLLRHILGLETPARGTVTLMGRPVAEQDPRSAASRVGMLFQHGALFSAFSVVDNIAFGLNEWGHLPRELARDMAMVKLQMVGLEARHADKRPSDLSGGMVKRAALARALAMDPPLLLLDEPTAGLDPEGADDFCELLRSLHQELGLTVMMVTHDLDTLLALSTRIAVLADRKVVAVGTPQEVVDHPHPFIQAYFGGGRGQRALQALGIHGPASLSAVNAVNADSAPGTLSTHTAPTTEPTRTP